MRNESFDRLTFFQGLDLNHLQALQEIFVPCEYSLGDTLFVQGAPAAYLYLVAEGEVSIRYKPEDAPEIIITHVRPGGVVGWSAALGNECYTSAAICSQDTRALRASGLELRRLCSRCPETGEIVLDRLAKVIAERLMHTHEHVLALLKQGLRDGSS